MREQLSEIIKYGKAYAVMAMATKAGAAVALVVGAAAFALGDGGTLTVQWAPGGAS
ncbi:hypothetical protein [Marinimicrobium sp. C2-29]|uniref:hypothetical protein n=1 Tax=Marinimicrobium sp. C2-29 TaxID=3139825 RepID=UPI0031395551